MLSDIPNIRSKIIEAGYKAVQELIKVAEENIVNGEDSDISADKLKNAAQAKKLAVFDAFEILARIELEKENLDGNYKTQNKSDTRQGFAERRSKSRTI